MTDLDALAREMAEHVMDHVEKMGVDSQTVADIAARILPALLRARNEAIEEAAKVAEAHHYDPKHSDFSAGASIAVGHIATAIRALKTEGE